MAHRLGRWEADQERRATVSALQLVRTCGAQAICFIAIARDAVQGARARAHLSGRCAERDVGCMRWRMAGGRWGVAELLGAKSKSAPLVVVGAHTRRAHVQPVPGVCICVTAVTCQGGVCAAGCVCAVGRGRVPRVDVSRISRGCERASAYKDRSKLMSKLL